MNLFEILSVRSKDLPDCALWEDELYGVVTFRDAEEQSARVYRFLKDAGIGKEDVVTIRMTRSVRVLIVMLGVWKAGAAFAVIGEQSPQEIVDFVLEDTAPKLIFDDAMFERATACEGMSGFEQVDLHDLACIVYSTGSTGHFKGSMHEFGSIQQAVDASASWGDETQAYSWIRTTLDAGLYAMSAVVMVIDNIVCAYYAYLIPWRMIGNEVFLNELLLRQKINSTSASPSRLESLRRLRSPYLKSVFVSFDMTRCLPVQGLHVCNMYGMSESATILAWFNVDRAYDIVPAGKPSPGVELRLVDQEDRPVEDGAIGEICFATRYFRGYRNRPDLTSAVLHDGWFHTGDMGFFNEDGNLVVIGRKIDIHKDERGYIVPCFISVQVDKRFPDITDNHVRIFEHDDGPKICLYYCGARTHTLEEFRSILRNDLPERMLPTHCKRLERFTYFPSGKINRLAFEELI